MSVLRYITLFILGFGAFIVAQPDSTELDLLASAQNHLAEGRYKTARIAFTIYLKDDSTSYTALFGMARVNVLENQFTDAVYFYNKILHHYQEDPDAILGRARVYAWQGDYVEAEKEFISVTKRFPDYEDAWVALGDLYTWWEKLDEADEAYSHLIALKPENPLHYTKRGNIYLLLGRLEEAEMDLVKAVSLGGETKETLALLKKLDRAPGKTHLNGGFLYVNEAFSSNPLLNWSAYREMGKLSGSKGTYIFHGIQAFRGGNGDDAIALDMYFNLWSKAYMNVYGQVTGSPTFLPYSVVRGEFFQGLANGWETSLGITRMNFPGNPVNMYLFTGGKYLGKWYTRGKMLFVPFDDEVQRLYTFSGRRFLKTVNQHIEFMYGWSAVPSTIISTDDLSRAEAILYGISFQKQFWNQFLLFVTWGYRQETNASTQTISFGFWVNSS